MNVLYVVLGKLNMLPPPPESRIDAGAAIREQEERVRRQKLAAQKAKRGHDTPIGLEDYLASMGLGGRVRDGRDTGEGG